MPSIRGKIACLTQLSYYGKLHDLKEFAGTPEEKSKSSGYVVDSIGAIAGGLAGLYYGYESIPKDWLAVTQRREWLEEMCFQA